MSLTFEQLCQIKNNLGSDYKYPKKIRINSQLLDELIQDINLIDDKKYKGRNEFLGIPFEIDNTILTWKAEY